MSNEWDEQLTEDEQNLAASLADLTSVRYGGRGHRVGPDSTAAGRVRWRAEEPEPQADADPGTQRSG